MLTIDLATATATDLRKLQPGQLFLYESGGEHSLAVAMKQEDKSAIWLTLSGATAFQMGMLERAHHQLRVLALGIDANSLTARIDQQHITSKGSAYQVGQLIFSQQDGVCIAAEWPNLRGKGYNNIVKLSGWDQLQDQSDGFRAAKWALGYVDQAGNWVDLVRRDPPEVDQ